MALRIRQEASIVCVCPPRLNFSMPRHQHRSGFVVWLTGLSGAGKSTIAGLLENQLETQGFLVDTLDGDVVRTHLSMGLGYSKADRDTNVARIAWVASRLARAGAIVIVSAISPYAEARLRARKLIEEQTPFVEVYVATELAECIRRDPKGLYARALADEIPMFTGITDPYEEPTHPDLKLDTTGQHPLELSTRVLTRLVELELIATSNGVLSF
jgi:adenylyl-sulfate kinase